MPPSLAVTRPARRRAGLQDIIDIAGKSGAIYRFRRHQDGEALPATAGNYVYVSRNSGEFVLVCCGETHSLTEAYRLWDRARTYFQASEVYLRLNVSRAKRVEECDDIVAEHNPPMKSEPGE